MDVLMECADEDFELQLFTPSGEGDYVCTNCGWHQTTSAAGAAELCLHATWHDGAAYQHYANRARAGGFTVPDTPPRVP